VKESIGMGIAIFGVIMIIAGVACIGYVVWYGEYGPGKAERAFYGGERRAHAGGSDNYLSSFGFYPILY